MSHSMLTLLVVIRVAPDIISVPGSGRNPAKLSYPAISGLPHCVIGQEFIVLQIP